MHTWRIDQLADLVGQALDASAYNGQKSGRVREVPDTRTIRYYTTLGMVDRPLEIRGRTAFYGPRHLLQLVAIKRLQARGMSLVEVQQALAGADDGVLRRLADLPEGVWEQVAQRGIAKTEAACSAPPCAAESREGFWAAVPEERTADEPSAASDSLGAPLPAVHLEVAPGVTLVVESIDPARLSPAVLEQLAPWLGQLRRRLGELGLVSDKRRETR